MPKSTTTPAVQPVSAEVVTMPEGVSSELAARSQPELEATGVETVQENRKKYRDLADRLVLDQKAWVQYFNRCEMLSGVQMYGHKDARTLAAAGLKGMSLGMSFMEAIDRIKVINGTPVIRGPAAINHIHERCPGARCRCTEASDDHAVWTFERPGWETKEFRFSMDDAKRAGLTERNKQYQKYPKRMLKWQCASEGAQEMFGDVLGGLYFQEELSHKEDEPEAPTVGSLPARPGGYGGGPRHSQPEPEQEPRQQQHPKALEVTNLLDQVVETFQGSDRRVVYRDVAKRLGISEQNPTLPELDKVIVELKNMLSNAEG